MRKSNIQFAAARRRQGSCVQQAAQPSSAPAAARPASNASGQASQALRNRPMA